MNEGIPAVAQTRTGYFATTEVETVLSLLSVIDNPMQDIPMAAVLRSPIIGMNDNEMAWMMAAYKRFTEKNQDRGVYAAWKLWEECRCQERSADEIKNGVSVGRVKVPEDIADSIWKKLERFAALVCTNMVFG